MRRRNPEHKSLRVLEWVFLLVGLIALDCYVWVNASSVLYQSYEDWAFDQTLRGLQPSVGGFVDAEARRLWSGKQPPTWKPPQTANLPKAPTPAPEKPGEAPLGPQAIVGRLEIPRLKLSVMVRQGADEATLARAVGHIPGTALPGYIGNVGLAGHRDTFFRPLRHIHKDDLIEVQTTHGIYRYRVESTQVVSPRDVGVLKASGGNTLTLVTCYPFYYVGSAPKRFIVHAVQMGSIRPPPPGS